MIRHIVLLKVRKDAPKENVDRAFAELAALKDKIPGILAFSHGNYSSDEGLNRGFTDGFVMDFESAAARDAYLPHPEHEKVKKMVVEILDGGVDGALAYDYEV